MDQILSLTTRTQFVLIVVLLFNWTAVVSQENSFAVKELPDPVLQEKLSSMVKNFRGDVGLYVRHLSTGRTAAIRAEELFPTASMIKVPIMLRLFEKIH